ncbi:hypothetical protein AAVH_27418 [Aphelenchoides avenae]|nr:hypothetical protein AAVH_27418 [Aphelenchus avenae]
MVSNVLIHCRRNASTPPGLGKPSERLPKRKWSTIMYSGETLGFEDVDEKAVYVFENPALPKKITAVFARYQSNAADSRPIVTCNFFSNASSVANIGDFSEKHNDTIGRKWYECVTY